MALGYEIGTIMKRTSVVYADSRLTVKLDSIEGMDQQFVQVRRSGLQRAAQMSRAVAQRAVASRADAWRRAIQALLWVLDLNWSAASLFGACFVHILIYM